NDNLGGKWEENGGRGEGRLALSTKSFGTCIDENGRRRRTHTRGVTSGFVVLVWKTPAAD
ncbi:hypothetical protein BaRGS_00016192, partial [Batillaria attramentaria]